MSTSSASMALAPRLVETSSARALHYGLLIAFGVALITLSAKIQVPFWPVPMTLQTMAIMGIGAAYGLRLGTATVIAYLAVGLSGLPVFAGPFAGPAYFAGPTAGFLAGFVAIAAITGYAADKGFARNPVMLFSSILLADVICFVLGFVWLAFFFVSPKSGATLGAETAFAVGIAPYVLGDILKITLVALAVPALTRVLNR